MFNKTEILLYYWCPAQSPTTWKGTKLKKDLYCRITYRMFNGSDNSHISFNNIDPCKILEDKNESVTENGYVDKLCNEYKSCISADNKTNIGIQSGLNRSVFHIGNSRTATSLRIEPDHLPVIHLLYEGYPKLWLFLSQAAAKKLKTLIPLDQGQLIFIHPKFFLENYIPIELVLQIRNTGIYIHNQILCTNL
ncbi:unnamed protein product [Macrosiphum euphorbiae]|uniref:Uncharacterized protein n=1 Tax=Macrosiphum euphorbiae TaxID=13131 RepID=A0AAV0XYT4_9HEMI|nr:unnamed protein product [Macrosiphum euphorbiae]